MGGAIFTRCHHWLYSERDARPHGEAIPSGNMKDVRVHVHVCADAVASEALDNLIKHDKSAPHSSSKISSTDPEPFFFGPRSYNMPYDIERNPGSARCTNITQQNHQLIENRTATA